VEVAEERAFPTAEAVIRHGDGDGDVHADHAALAIELKLAGCAAVAGEDGGAVAKGVFVDEAEAFGVGGDAGDGEDGAEDFVLVAAHAGGDGIEEGGSEEEAFAMAGGVEAAIDDDAGTFGDGGIEIGGYPVAVLAGDERAHFGGVLGSGADLDPGHAGADGVDEGIGYGTDGDDDGDGHASFTGGAEGGGNGGIGGHGEIGVGKDEHVVFCSSEGLDALAVGRRGLVNGAGDGGGSDEADGLDIGMGEKAVDCEAVALNDVEDAVRQTCALEEFGEEESDGGILLGGL